ncbi:MAG: hypothetical protein U1E42_04270 [Rhodospirillales bacterium]
MLLIDEWGGARAGLRSDEMRVPFREIALHLWANEPPVYVYDSSSPYTDETAEIDIFKGCPTARRLGGGARGDVDRDKGRAVRPEDNGNAGFDRLVPVFPIARRLSPDAGQPSAAPGRRRLPGRSPCRTAANAPTES